MSFDYFLVYLGYLFCITNINKKEVNGLCSEYCQIDEHSLRYVISYLKYE